jgi:hypothetical protein
VVEKLEAIRDREGPEAIAGIVSNRLTNEEYYLFQKLFRDAIGTNQITHGGIGLCITKLEPEKVREKYKKPIIMVLPDIATDIGMIDLERTVSREDCTLAEAVECTLAEAVEEALCFGWIEASSGG